MERIMPDIEALIEEFFSRNYEMLRLESHPHFYRWEQTEIIVGNRPVDA
jgi:hypothetical protein